MTKKELNQKIAVAQAVSECEKVVCNYVEEQIAEHIAQLMAFKAKLSLIATMSLDGAEEALTPEVMSALLDKFNYRDFDDKFLPCAKYYDEYADSEYKNKLYGTSALPIHLRKKLYELMNEAYRCGEVECED